MTIFYNEWITIETNEDTINIFRDQNIYIPTLGGWVKDEESSLQAFAIILNPLE